MIHIGIVGSRKRSELERIHNILISAENTHDIITVVSGGAEGIDSNAYDVCKSRGIPILVIFPRLQEYYKKGNDIYSERNEIIARDSDYLYAFPLNRRGGTMNTVKHFIRLKGKNKLTIID